jgi:insecticidal toxin complex protein TccC
MKIQAKRSGFHCHSPTLRVTDSRRLMARSVGYYRSTGVEPFEERVDHTTYSAAGYAIAQRDPRLMKVTSASANLVTIYSLSGKVLSTISVDAGLRVSLFGEADQPMQSWDGRGSQRNSEYDNQLRQRAVLEQAINDKLLSMERYGYGSADPESADHNQCGQLIRHDDPAGTLIFTEFGLSGGLLEQTRHFLKDLEMPDWPESIADRELLLEPGEGASSRSCFNALGEAIESTDAKGHRQLLRQTLDGQLREVRLQLNGAAMPKTLVSAIHYNAHGQTEREVAGNGVITTLEYDAADGRLTRLQASRGSDPLQDLRYAYDAVGNVLSIEDAALPIRYFANQRIEPVNRYVYDSLYQLIEATGWEAGAANKGPQFSTFDDPAPRANYRQRYHYDAGGNLLELIHEGPQSHGRRLVAAKHSNRCLPVLEGVEPDEEDFRRGFDDNGNLLDLQPGQTLSWDLRNQLREVQPVERDSERYVYGANGMRVRKVRLTQTNARTLVSDVRYLPNLELRNHSGTGEVLQVISVQAGRSSVRVLRWEFEPPKASVNDQYRYSLNDHLGSCTLELDSEGT